MLRAFENGAEEGVRAFGGGVKVKHWVMQNLAICTAEEGVRAGGGGGV
jgi:hypothetical protein